MNHLNSVIIEGNLTREPEYKTADNGSRICTFPIAVDRSYKSGKGEKVKEVSFFPVETFGKLAENCARYCQKGRGVRVVGRVKQNRWTAQDGKAQSRVTIIAEHVEFKPQLKSIAATETKEKEAELQAIKEATVASYEQSCQEEALEEAAVF